MVKAPWIAVGCCAAVLVAAGLTARSGSFTEETSAPARAASATASRSTSLPGIGRIFLSDAQLRQALKSGTIDRPVKSLLAVDRPLKFGDYKWNDAAVPAGPTWIRIDLNSQLMSVFRAGNEIGTAGNFEGIFLGGVPITIAISVWSVSRIRRGSRVVALPFT